MKIGRLTVVFASIKIVGLRRKRNPRGEAGLSFARLPPAGFRNTEESGEVQYEEGAFVQERHLYGPPRTKSGPAGRWRARPDLTKTTGPLRGLTAMATSLHTRSPLDSLAGQDREEAAMRKLATVIAVVGATTAIALGLAAVPKVVQAIDLCDTALPTGITNLGHSHDCSGTTGLIIAENGTTVDLGGFTLTGDPSASATYGVDNTGGFDNVTIQNGVIEGFEQGVRAVDCSELTLTNLTFTGQTSSHAVDILNCANVAVKDSSFTMPVPSQLASPFIFSPEAIRLEGVDGVVVERVDVQGGFIGVNFACAPCPDVLDGPTNGEVIESIFHGTFIGVLIANSIDATVEENHMSGGVDVICLAGDCDTGPVTLSSKGISAGGFGAPVSDIDITDNHVHDNTVGIRLSGVVDSEVSRNEVHVNSQDGILVVSSSTGNEIKDNVATGNGDGTSFFDPRHDGSSTGNVWTGNVCDTSSGAEAVADCP